MPLNWIETKNLSFNKKFEFEDSQSNCTTAATVFVTRLLRMICKFLKLEGNSNQSKILKIGKKSKLMKNS